MQVLIFLTFACLTVALLILNHKLDKAEESNTKMFGLLINRGDIHSAMIKEFIEMLIEADKKKMTKKEHIE
jgi:hypothetical protein